MRSPFRPLIGLAALLAAAVVLLSSCGSSSGTANIRMLNVSTGYSSLDLYASNNSNTNPSYFGGIQGTTYEVLNNYTLHLFRELFVGVRTTGSTSALATDGSENLTDGSAHNLYVGYGSSGNFATVKIGEDQSSANSGYAKVTVINASEAGNVDVYLTDSTTALVNASPVVSNMATGATSTVTVTSGNYRLRVVGTGDTTDLRADVAQVTFNSTTVDSLLLTSTTGGMLVNVSLVPQQGSLTTYNTAQARILNPIAVGIANGTTVNATIQGANILTNATAGVIGGIYTLVDAGSNLPVNLSVDGTAVTVPSQTLAAGADYTLLVWSNASGTQTSLISDINTLPANLASKARVRLLNGMSGLADPLTLLVNFETDATGVTLGSASDSTSAQAEFASGTNNEVDVVDTNTAATLSSQTTADAERRQLVLHHVHGRRRKVPRNRHRKDR